MMLPTMCQTIYANRVNLRGIYTTKPFTCNWVPDRNAWIPVGYGDWNFEIRSLGEETFGAVVTFSSVSKKEVQIWTDGILAVLKLFRPETVEHPR